MHMVQYNDHCNAAEVVEASYKAEAWAKKASILLLVKN